MTTFEIIAFLLKTFFPKMLEDGKDVIEGGYRVLSDRDAAIQAIKGKKGSVTVMLGTRETGKTELAWRWAEFLGRKTYAVSPEQKPLSWIERIQLDEIDTKIDKHSTLICDDLPAYASNRDYNDALVKTLEKIIPMCRHERELHLIFCSQSSAQADKYILDCDIAFFKPLGLLYEDLERPNIRKIYKTCVDEYFANKPDSWIVRHAWMRSRLYNGGIEIKKAARQH